MPGGTEPDLPQVKAVADSFAAMTLEIGGRLRTSRPAQADSMFLENYRFGKRRLFNALYPFHSRLVGGFEDSAWMRRTLSAPVAERDRIESGIIRSLMAGGVRMEAPGIGARPIHFVKGRFHKLFGSHVSRDLERCLALMEEEWDAPLDGNGTCTWALSFREISERLAAWEAFLNRHPDSRYLPLAKTWFATYLRAFVLGGEGTPVILGTGGVEDLLPIYRAYIRRHPGKESTRIVERFLEIRKESGYKQVENLEARLGLATVPSVVDFD